MVETLFVQLGSVLVNISKVRAIAAHPDGNKVFVHYDGESGGHNPMVIDCSFEHVQRMLAETYQQMAMMQAAANRGGYSPMGGVQ